MKFERLEQISPEFIRQYREHLRLSQSKFWGDIGISVNRGQRYEYGSTVMPETIRRLLFLRYAIGVKTDASGEELFRLAKSYNGRKAAELIEHAQQLLQEAHELLKGEP